MSHLEIERKFLVRSGAWQSSVRKSAWMRQGYLNHEQNCSVRVRIAGEEAWLNLKGVTIGAQRLEYEYPIPLADAQHLLDNLTCKPLIEKTRHWVDVAGHTWEIDVFSGDNAGLIVAEIELDDPAEPFEKPDWLGDEVTDDPRYYNTCLSSHPYRFWQGRNARMPLSQSQFLWIATAFEGGLVLIAYALGGWVSIDPLGFLRLDVMAAFWGLLGSLLLYGLFIVSERMEAARHIREFLIDKMGGLLAGCSGLELLYLGFLAGITEEILFRGVLQPWLERDWGWAGGLVFSNMIFALVHWITPTYALLAGLCGLFLGLLLDIGAERNLLTPILTHAIYDFLAFLVVAQAWRARQATS